jgi:hypothetical protein
MAPRQTSSARRKARKIEEEKAAMRRARIAKLTSWGWLAIGSEIPEDAIPVDPELIRRTSPSDRPTFYRDVEFLCVDCGKAQTWKAEDQQWYYETAGGMIENIAKRCRPCRMPEKERKRLARIAAGHAPREGAKPSDS